MLRSAENNFITFSLHLLYLPFHFKNFTEEMLKHFGIYLFFWWGVGGNFSSETAKDPLIIICPSTKSETPGLNFEILEVNHDYGERREAPILSFYFLIFRFYSSVEAVNTNDNMNRRLVSYKCISSKLTRKEISCSPLTLTHTHVYAYSS